MPTEYVVEEGDCISSIADAYGFVPDTIWNHPSNAKLKTLRKDANVLMPGDKLVIPDKEIKQVSKSTNQVCKFQRKGVPEKLRVQLLLYDRPRANLKYTLVLDSGKHLAGTTDGNGFVEAFVPPQCHSARLIISPEEEYDVEIGRLNPVGTESGVRQRLRNLGYLPRRENGESGGDTSQPDDSTVTRTGPDGAQEEDTVRALFQEPTAMSDPLQFPRAVASFQRDQNLPVTGKVDDLTRKKLVEVHQS
jgi:N-acetylmuramoyl-L-alanine amidase